MRIVTLGAFMACLGLASTSLAQQAPASAAQSVRQILAVNESAEPYLNGGVMMVDNGRALVQATTGFADFATRRPLESDAVFPLASGAKPFTSVAVLQLRDRGLLNLDDPVARHLEGFPYPLITVRHLLTHTSGLPDLELFEPLIAREPDHVVTGADLIAALRSWSEPLRFEAGAEFRYSNINYQVLALLTEQVSGQPFWRYMRDNVFEPARMRSSYVLGGRALGRHEAPVTRHVFAVMYRTEPEDVRRLDYQDRVMMRPYRYEGFNLGATVGDQNLFTTLDDLRRFDAALRSGRVLSAASQAEAYAPARLRDGSEYQEPNVYELYGARCSYGMGWETCVHPVRGRLVGHAGFSRGIATMIYRALDSGHAAFMFDNGDTGAFNQKFASLMNVMNGEAPLEISRRRSATRVYGEALLSTTPTAALITYNRLRTQTDQWATTPAGLNQLGYDFLRNGHPALALEPFRINLVLTPNDANAYDSYGEALAVNGRREEAIAAYRRSLELNPNNARGRQALEGLEAAQQ